MNAEPDQFANVRDILPPGSIPLHAVRVVQFLTPDGDVSMDFTFDGVERVVTTIGLLAWVQHQCIHLGCTETP